LGKTTPATYKYIKTGDLKGLTKETTANVRREQKLKDKEKISDFVHRTGAILGETTMVKSQINGKPKGENTEECHTYAGERRSEN